MTDFISICLPTHVHYSYLVGSFSICQKLDQLVYMELKAEDKASSL